METDSRSEDEDAGTNNLYTPITVSDDEADSLRTRRDREAGPGAANHSLNAPRTPGEEERSGVAETAKYPYGPLAFIMGTNMWQSYSSSGLQVILELYFTRFLLLCSARASSLSTTSVNVYIAITQLCAIPAGVLADRVLGNYVTQFWANVLNSAGICLLVLASWQYTLEQPHCCLQNHNTSGIVGGGNHAPSHPHTLTSQHHSGFSSHPHSLSFDASDGAGSSLTFNTNCSVLDTDVILPQANFHMPPLLNMVLAFCGLVLFGIGYGLTTAIQSVFIADQFKEQESMAKERSFSWYYLWGNVGSLFGEMLVPILRQTVGFVITLLTVLGATLSATLLFVAGTCLYIRKRPYRPDCCLCAGGRGRREGSEVLSTLETEPLLKDGASTKVPRPQQTSLSVLRRWRELVPFLGVFGPLVVFWSIFYQQNSTWILQGEQMDCYLGRLHVPPDMMLSINPLLDILIIPCLDYLIYPHLLRSMRFRVRPLHKMVVGMVCAALSFLMAGLLQIYVHLPADMASCHGNVSIAWQLPQIALLSVAEVMVSITGLEFAYSQAPPDFRNIITSFWYISQALGTLLNAGIAQIPMSLTYEFFVYMILMVAVTVLFVVINRNYWYRKVAPSTEETTTEGS